MTQGTQEEMLLVTSRSQIQAKEFRDLNKISWYKRQLLIVKVIIVFLLSTLSKTYSLVKKYFSKQNWQEIKTFLPVFRSIKTNKVIDFYKRNASYAQHYT